MGKSPRVAIIGAGLSGMTLAIELKKRLGLTTFTIYERASEVGGTWRDNYYPGCACDVPSHWYSLSTELNPNWSARYASQPEIQKYWLSIWHKHNLEKCTQFDCNFVEATWNTSTQTYTILFQKLSDKTQTWTVECDVLVSAIGGFSTPLDRPPGMKGLETFKGEYFHSARWRYDVSLKNKRVGVIGNGCSAAQFIPKLAQDPTSQIINFSRTPSWFVPRYNDNYSSFTKWIFAHVPGIMKSYRNTMALALDARFVAWILSNQTIRHYAEEDCIKYITSVAPKKYHDFLIPSYPLGCKRVIIDPGYLKCLNRPNVELVTDPIDSIVENGIKGKSGKVYEFDVLILGTGFDVTEVGLGINVTGSNKMSVTQQWIEQNGPQAYLGTTISNYPNFYTILGPNVATGHASVIASTEAQVNYIVKMIGAMKKYEVRSFELKPSAEVEYNNMLRKRLDNTVWQGGCKSYYKLPNGKVIATFPGTMAEFWWRTKTPNFEHYLQRGGKVRVAARQRLKSLFKWALFLLVLVGLSKFGVAGLKTRAINYALMGYSRIAALRHS